jgi:hypothetical protein
VIEQTLMAASERCKPLEIGKFAVQSVGLTWKSTGNETLDNYRVLNAVAQHLDLYFGDAAEVVLALMDDDVEQLMLTLIVGMVGLAVAGYGGDFLDEWTVEGRP